MRFVGFIFGIGFGFLIAASRLSDYDVIHRMLLLQDLEPFLLMGVSVAVAMPLIWIFERRKWHTPLGGLLAIPRGPIEGKHGEARCFLVLDGPLPGLALARSWR